MRRFQISITVALVHAVAMAAAMALTIADLGHNFPHSPSLVGRVMGGVAYVLGFPLVSGALLTDNFPLFGPVWQPYTMLAANSALWGIAAAVLWRHAPSARVRRSG